MTRGVSGAAVLAALAGCVSSGPRPIPPSAEAIIAAPVGVTRAALPQAVSNLGLQLRPTAAEGQVETDYIDVAEYIPAASQYPRQERLVRFILNAWQDPNGPGSHVAIRAIYSPFRAGISNTRRGERAVPRDHPAMELVRDLMTEIRKAEGG